MVALQQKIGNLHDWFAVAVMVQPAATIVGRWMTEHFCDDLRVSQVCIAVVSIVLIQLLGNLTLI